MLSDLLFMVKSLIFTFIVLILLQIKIGETTLEAKTYTWIQSSAVVAPIQEVADGGVVLIRQVWRKVSSSFKGDLFSFFDRKKSPGERTLGIKVERSAKYLQEKAEQASESLKRQAKQKATELQEYIEQEPEALEE